MLHLRTPLKEDEAAARELISSVTPPSTPSSEVVATPPLSSFAFIYHFFIIPDTGHRGKYNGKSILKSTILTSDNFFLNGALPICL